MGGTGSGRARNRDHGETASSVLFAESQRKGEFNYQRPLCALLAAHGFRYDPEVTQTCGRSDLIAEHPCGIYIFELKVDSTAAEALERIREKGYANPYLAEERPVYLVGLNFDSKTRQLTDTAWEKALYME